MHEPKYRTRYSFKQLPTIAHFDIVLLDEKFDLIRAHLLLRYQCPVEILMQEVTETNRRLVVRYFTSEADDQRE